MPILISMSTRTREKQALGVFAVLIVLSLLGLGWYLVAGHSWNVAASTIDEKVGQMDGYVALVYSGTVLPEPEEVASASSSKNADRESAAGKSESSSSRSVFDSLTSNSKKSASSSSTMGDMRSDEASGFTSDVAGIAAPVVSDDEDSAGRSASAAAGASTPSSLTGEVESYADASQALSGENANADKRVAASSGDGSTPSAEGDSAADGASVADNTSAADDDSAAAVSGSMSDDASSDMASSGRKALVSPKANPVEPESVRDSYLEKGAQVLVLDTKHPSVYEDGMIVKRGSKRIGVFSVDVPLSEEAAQERLDYFKEAKVDVVVCIASVCSYVRNATGIDVVVTLQDDVSTMGTNANGTFYVNAPSIDSVGAVLLSPNNVVSAKVVDSL